MIADVGREPDLADAFAKYVAAARYEDLSLEAIEAAKKSTLDTIGVILGAAGTTPTLGSLVDMVKDADGKEESTIIGFGGRIPSFMAAFLNGAMAHCLDFDDHLPEGHHPSSAVIPATLAISERAGGINGRDFITAVVVAQDIFARLRRNVEWKQDWHLTTVLAVFAAALACGKILRLNSSQLVDAEGIALCQSAGTLEFAYGTGSDIRGMYAGFSSKAGVISALMAQCGITGTKTCFEGKAGFLNVYFDGKYDRAGILDGLGSRFAGANIVYKPWPSCGITHVYIDAALELMRAHDIKPADVRAVKVFVGDAAQHLCEPLAGRQKPVTIVDAKFSIPFSIAVAIVHGNVKIDNFTAAALKDSDVLAMAAKVVPVPDANLNWDDGLPTGEVELTTYRGVAFRRRVSSPLGSPEKPMTWNNLEDKFADCARFSKKRLSDDNIKAFCSLVRKLEELPDIRNVVTCVA